MINVTKEKEIKENKKYVSADYLKRIAQHAEHIKKRSYALMNIQTDSIVLDIGCGPASDTIPLAEYIGSAGKIVGIDNDPEMLEKADKELQLSGLQKDVSHIQADVQSLPFSSSAFDSCRTERLFQVLPRSISMDSVFSEIDRVLKSGGTIVLVDADWGSATVNFSDTELERRLINFFATGMRPNGFAGRQLFELLQRNAYLDIRVDVVPFIANELSETMFGDWLREEALKNTIATLNEMDNWRAELENKSSKGAFFACVNMVIVAGKKA
jgi:ubiquinone/menaquinone biosynthesis C-methylase UbiE